MNKLREDEGCSAITHHKNVPLKKVFAKKIPFFKIYFFFFKSLLVKKMELLVSPSDLQSDQVFWGGLPWCPTASQSGLPIPPPHLVPASLNGLPSTLTPT